MRPCSPPDCWTLARVPGRCRFCRPRRRKALLPAHCRRCRRPVQCAECAAFGPRYRCRMCAPLRICLACRAAMALTARIAQAERMSGEVPPLDRREAVRHRAILMTKLAMERTSS